MLAAILVKDCQDCSGVSTTNQPVQGWHSYEALLVEVFVELSVKLSLVCSYFVRSLYCES